MKILDYTSVADLDTLRNLKGKLVYFSYSKPLLRRAVYLRNIDHIGVLEKVMTWPSTTSIFHIKDHVNPRPYIVAVEDDGELFYRPLLSPDDNNFLAGKTIIHKITGEEVNIKKIEAGLSFEGGPSLISSTSLLAEYIFEDGSPCGYPITFSELECLRNK